MPPSISHGVQKDVNTSWANIPTAVLTYVHDIQMLRFEIVYRLWCAWEMYVFFSMSQKANRLRIIPVGDNKDMLHRLQHFKASEAHCWSPEDEALLRSIINENVAKFEHNIQQHARHATLL